MVRSKSKLEPSFKKSSGRFEYKMDIGRVGIGKYHDDIFAVVITKEGPLVNNVIDYCQRFGIPMIITTEMTDGFFWFRANIKLNDLSIRDMMDLFIYLEKVYDSSGEIPAPYQPKEDLPEDTEIPLSPN